MARLADVAREAGVSAATVSRALTRPDMVSEATRTRVLAAAERLGYRYNAAARALATGRTGLLAVSVPSLANPYHAPVLAGAQQAAEEADRELLVVVTGGSPDRERSLFDRLAERVDGFAAIIPVSPPDRLAAMAGRTPLVTLDRRAPGVPSVVIDTPSGLVELGAHLAGLGHRRVAYLGGPAGSWMDPRRRAALEKGAAGAEVVALGPFPPEYEAGIAALDEVRARSCTAVVSYSSTLLLGVLYRMSALGLRAPGDLSLACADDLSAAGLAVPDVTALRVPSAEAGRAAVARLLAPGPRAAGPAHALLPVELIVRSSTGAPAL